ncbi:DUF6049 family protein [Streptomyces sp. BI20]|uniref:DUF6049 family protein n=1 Tax=Streptomyces sp. BI20 TaxID=3403460 RepID=UPI003C767737
MAEPADTPGKAPLPARRRWFRRVAVLLAGTPVLISVVQVPAAPAQAAQGDPVDVSLSEFSPGAPVKGDTLTVSGQIVNKGKEAITGGRIGLRVGEALTDRDAVEAAGEQRTRSGWESPDLDKDLSVELPAVPAGAGREFTLRIPVAKLPVDKDGVYPIGVTVSGGTANRPAPRVLGVERTLLPWQPETSGKTSETAWLWPLISTAHVTAQTRSDEVRTPVFANEDLADELRPGGRLERLVALGERLPVTWVVDPDLLATVDAMAQGYEVQGADGRTVPGAHKADAARWLTALQTAVRGKKVVALPFADPDLASLAHRGKDVSGSLGQLRPATDKAKQAVEVVLHVTPSTDYSWPIEGAVDPAIVNVAGSAGAHAVLARGDSIKESPSLGHTPSAARPIGGGTTAVVADARMSTAFDGDMLSAGNSVLAAQQALAQSLAMNLESVDGPRGFLVAPMRMPTASQAHTMAEVIGTLAAGRWTKPADLDTVTRIKPDPGAATRVPGTGSYPDELRETELPTTAFEQIRTTQRTLDHFQSILSEPGRVTIPFGNTINREMSTSWRGRAGEARTYREQSQDHLVALTERVRLIPKSDATLSGHNATIPITVENNLVQDVNGLVLRLKSANPTRLMFDDSGEVEQEITVQGGHRQSVKISANATASGPVEVTAQLYTRDGLPYGKERRFTVEATEITSTVMLVIGGGVLLLVLAGIKMYASRKRAAARAAGSEDTQPSDEGTDTGPQSTGTAGSGEKVDR